MNAILSKKQGNSNEMQRGKVNPGGVARRTGKSIQLEDTMNVLEQLQATATEWCLKREVAHNNINAYDKQKIRN